MKSVDTIYVVVAFSRIMHQVGELGSSLHHAWFLRVSVDDE